MPPKAPVVQEKTAIHPHDVRESLGNIFLISPQSAGKNIQRKRLNRRLFPEKPAIRGEGQFLAQVWYFEWLQIALDCSLASADGAGLKLKCL